MEEKWIEVEGKNIQIKKVWEGRNEALLIVVNGSPGIAMKMPGIIESKRVRRN